MPASAIEGVLVPGCMALAPAVSRNGGVTVYKKGYHGPRNWMRTNYPDNYSIQLDIDQLGPGDEGSAFDWTFDDARLRSDFRTIAVFTRRLIEAGRNHDPRTYPLREVFGNADLDREVEGWSFYRDREATSEDSHLWHIHFSVWRKYINDEAAMRSILSILRGDEYQGGELPTPADMWKWDGIPNVWETDNMIPPASNPTVQGLNAVAETGRDVLRVQRQLADLEEKVDAILAKLSSPSP